MKKFKKYNDVFNTEKEVRELIQSLKKSHLKMVQIVLIYNDYIGVDTIYSNEEYAKISWGWIYINQKMIESSNDEEALFDLLLAGFKIGSDLYNVYQEIQKKSKNIKEGTTSTIDFLWQELHRELSPYGSKIEKIRMKIEY